MARALIAALTLRLCAARTLLQGATFSVDDLRLADFDAWPANSQGTVSIPDASIGVFVNVAVDANPNASTYGAYVLSAPAAQQISDAISGLVRLHLTLSHNPAAALGCAGAGQVCDGRSRCYAALFGTNHVSESATVLRHAYAPRQPTAPPHSCHPIRYRIAVRAFPGSSSRLTSLTVPWEACRSLAGQRGVCEFVCDWVCRLVL